MHIPDNFLSTPVWAALDVIAAPAVVALSRKASRKMRQEPEESQLPLLGVMGAFVFAAQMVNFPVGVGTSGHLVGGTLLAVLLGPAAASLVVTAILIVQALVFQDGGVLALGANVFNMAILGVLAGYAPYALLKNTRWRTFGIFAGGVCSVMTSSVLALLELGISGIRMPTPVLLISSLFFLMNALIEGAITVSVVRGIERLRGSSIRAEDQERSAIRTGRPAVALGIAAVLLASIGVLIASNHPDGLEHLIEKLGIVLNESSILSSPFPDYEIPAWGSGWISKATAGLAGLIIIYAVCALSGRLLARTRRT